MRYLRKICKFSNNQRIDVSLSQDCGKQELVRVIAISHDISNPSLDEQRYVSPYYIFGELSDMRTKKQPVPTRSNAEAEFRTMAQGVGSI